LERSVEGLVDLVNELRERHVHFKSLTYGIDRVPNSKLLDRDLARRVLLRLRITERRLVAGEVFLLSDVNPRSFDGRYFGSTQRGCIQEANRARTHLVGFPDVRIFRSDWNDFPDVVVQTTVTKLTTHPKYREAKQGKHD
jgi:hypothetical protein